MGVHQDRDEPFLLFVAEDHRLEIETHVGATSAGKGCPGLRHHTAVQYRPLLGRHILQPVFAQPQAVDVDACRGRPGTRLFRHVLHQRMIVPQARDIILLCLGKGDLLIGGRVPPFGHCFRQQDLPDPVYGRFHNAASLLQITQYKGL